MGETCNCEGCLYRIILAEQGEHITRDEGCDQPDTDFCKKMNDPAFQAWVKYGGLSHGESEK